MRALASAVVCAILTAFSAQSVSAVNVGTEVIIFAYPNSPSGLYGVANSPTQITLSWTDNSLNELGFELERKTGVAGTYSLLATTSVSIATFTDNDVSPNTVYFYRVRSYNGDGASPYSGEASITTPSNTTTSSGGGGGGGGYYLPPPSYTTKVVFKGLAYPMSDVTLLKDGQVVAVTKSGPDSRFEIELSNLSPGTFLFGIWAEDKSGNRSITQTFSIALVSGATTIVGGIFIPPFINLDKSEVKKGEVITFYGVSAPNATISLTINSDDEIIKLTTSTNDGLWSIKFGTDPLQYGEHFAKARAAKDDDITSFSRVRSFIVSDKTIYQSGNKCPLKGDFNGDCRVNLVDFSILAYWYKRPLPDNMSHLDLNSDGKISLVDFSIMAYYWTG